MKSNLEKAKILFCTQLHSKKVSLDKHHNRAVSMSPVEGRDLLELCHFEIKVLLSQLMAGADLEILDNYFTEIGERLAARDYMNVARLIELTTGVGEEWTLWDDEALNLAEHIKMLCWIMDRERGKPTHIACH